MPDGIKSNLTFNHFVRHSDRAAYEAAGWKLLDDLAGTHHGDHAVMMTRDLSDIEESRISVVTANLTVYGEVELIGRMNNKEFLFVMPRNVAAALIASVGCALAEI